MDVDWLDESAWHKEKGDPCLNFTGSIKLPASSSENYDASFS